MANHVKEIRDFVIANFLFGDGSALKDDASFIETGVIDSTGILELIMFIENTYSLKVQNEDMVPENFDSVNRIAAYVAKRQAQAGAN
jgi:acyl carrier protein